MLWEHEVPGSNPGAPILVLRYLHLLAMAVFVGGQLVLAFAVVPALRARPAGAAGGGAAVRLGDARSRWRVLVVTGACDGVVVLRSGTTGRCT